MAISNTKIIQVCSACLTASCWHGEFMCDNSRGAGTVLKTVGELRRLTGEHPDNWASEKLIAIYGELPSYTWRGY